MDDPVLQQVVQQHGLSLFAPQHPPTSVLQSLPLHVSFDHGYFLTVRAIQELRDKKQGPVFVGIGGPSGSGKTSLATRIASVLGGAVLSMENYYDPQLTIEDSYDFDSIDFDLLIQNLEVLLKGKDIMIPQFDFQEKKRIGYKTLKAPKSGVVIVEGTYALSSKLRSFLDIRVAVVGGVHFSLLTKVRRDIGETLSLDHLLDSIFPMFRTHIEPDLHHAQIKISNSFVSSLREPYYILKCEKQISKTSIEALFSSNKPWHEEFINMYLRAPSSTESKPGDWIRMRQLGVKYDLTEGDQRIVDKHFIIKPKVEFEVGKTTLGGLLALGYQIAVSFKRESIIWDNGKVCISLETIDDLGESFIQLKGTDRKVVSAEASRLGLHGPWITKSYMEMVLDKKGPLRLDSPPLPSSTFLRSLSSSAFNLFQTADKNVVTPRPVRVTSDRGAVKSEVWTRSPTKSDAEPSTGSWQVAPSSEKGEHFSTSTEVFLSGGTPDVGDSSSKQTLKLLPLGDVFNFDRGLLLAVQAIQTLLNAKGPPIVVGIGGPSGAGKTSLAHKMANIIGCEVISMESYYRVEDLKEFKYDDFNALDLPLLLKNIADIKAMRSTTIPVFDFRKTIRSGSKELQISEECGVVIVEGVYALHPEIRPFLDVWIAVIGGVHSHLVARVTRDLEQCDRPVSRQEIMSTVFPMFEQCIEPHLVHAHLKVLNNFDPVHSPESSMFVLKSSKEVTFEEIKLVLDSDKMSRTVQNFIDIYFHLPVLSSNNGMSESNCIRVRNCEGCFALLIREPIREGDFIIQPKVDFDISVRTVAGLLTLGYQAVAYIEATATIYQDDKLLIEVDHLKNISSPYIQIKGSNKEAVAAAGQALKLEGTYTTMPYIDIIGQMADDNVNGDKQSARLQELVDFVQSQCGSVGSEVLASPTISIELILESFEARLKRLEKWQLINTVLWSFFMSAFLGYVLYQRSRKPRM